MANQKRKQPAASAGKKASPKQADAPKRTDKPKPANAPKRKQPQPEKTAAEESRSKPEKQNRKNGEKIRNYTLLDCMKLGVLGNIMFVIFIIICLIYYYSLARKGNYVIPFEVVAYGVEALGFALFTTSVIWLDRLVRARVLMKVLLLIYIVVEVILMLLEFQFLPWTYYNGISIVTVITHVIFSACVSFSLLMLEPHNKRVEIIVGITTAIILAGMFFGAAGYRVYASILVNAFAYIFFFTAMKRQIVLEEVLVDCYGDQAKVTSFSSTMFEDTPTMIEREHKKKTLKQRVKDVRNKLSLENEEHIVLTDKDEKFEYEFGVQDDDDDDEYEEYDDGGYEDDAEDGDDA
ncbi:MAG: hypothetical protein IJ060_02250 [Oscillospiraceae bacterium]|nr:hypothetical protein [Oscillospiraceae bacterium]